MAVQMVHKVLSE